MTITQKHICTALSILMLGLGCGVSVAATAQATPVNITPYNPNSWSRDVPLPEALVVEDSGRTRDDAGYYLRGQRKGNLRKIEVYYTRKMRALGWQQSLHKRAPGRVLRLAYVRGEQKLTLDLASTRTGIIVSMVVGPYNAQQGGA